MISVKAVDDKKVWEEFILTYEKTSTQPLGGMFLQSWDWGQFQRELGKEVQRVGVFDGGQLAGISLFYLQKAKTGMFVYVPVGPIFPKWRKNCFDKWLDFVVTLAKNKGASFLRIEPRVVSESLGRAFSGAGFIKAASHTQPECTAVVDLIKPEDKLLSAASDSTRYNVRASLRKGVIVRKGRIEEIQTFTNLLKETSKRKTFTLPLEKDYHKKQFETFQKEGLMELFIAEINGETLSAALVLFYNTTAYYLHAANSLKKKELRASYPLVWHCILESRKRGFKWFDFWGIAKGEDPGDPWAGVTSFKLSFGAERVCFDPVFDLPLKSTYLLTKVVETWRKPIRKIIRFR